MIALITHCFLGNEDAARHSVFPSDDDANPTDAALDIKNVNLSHANNFASFSVGELTEIIFLTLSLK